MSRPPDRAAGGSFGPSGPSPARIRATFGRRSGLGELLDFDFETLSLMQLYRASDALMKHRQAIETHLVTRAMGLFDLQPTVTLFDVDQPQVFVALHPRRSHFRV